MNRYFKYGLSSVVSVFLLGITTAALANGLYAPRAPQPYFNGLYVGIGGGVVAAQADVKSSSSNYFDQGEGYNFPVNHNFDKGEYGYNANIFAGYGKTENSSYYFGGELFAHYFSPKLKGSEGRSISNALVNETYIIDGNTKVKNSYSYGGDIRAGYLVSPRTMIYLLLGLDYAQFKVKDELTVSFYRPVIGLQWKWSGNFNNNFTKWKLGYFPGVGIETSLNDHISLRAQYAYTFYSSFDHTTMVSGMTKGPDPVSYNGNLTTKVKPYRQLFTIMLSYLFN